MSKKERKHETDTTNTVAGRKIEEKDTVENSEESPRRKILQITNVSEIKQLTNTATMKCFLRTWSFRMRY